MPPAAGSLYFPPLDRCLAGDIRLISWRTAHRTLCNELDALETSQLELFFTDPGTMRALSNAIDPFPKPSARSASELDTKTAPINVAQTSNGDYSLDELKADSRWLSGELQIEELAALRMAIIEWQERASDQLLLTATSGNNNLELSVEPGSSALARSLFRPAVSATASGPQPGLDFSKEEVRRRRLLNVYFSEKSHLLKIMANLVSRSAVSKSELQTHEVGALRENTKKTWIDVMATNLRNTACSADKVVANENFCSQCIGRVRAILEATENSSSWPTIFTNDPSKAQSYLDCQFSELEEILRLLLANLYAFDGVPSASTVELWFSTMDRCSFLCEQRTYFPSMDTVQLLISIISVEILKLQLVVGEIMSSAGIETPVLSGDFYIKSDRCLQALNSTFKNSVNMQIRIAAPCLYAWSIITSVLRDIAAIHRDAREGRLENSASEGLLESSRRGSRGSRSDIEHLYWEIISIPDWEAQPTGTSGAFAIAAVDRMDVFGLITVLNNVAGSTYSSAADSDTAYICKEALLDLMREGMPFVQYDAPVLDAILSVLTPFDLNSPSHNHTRVLAGKMLYDKDQLQRSIMEQALARYPYELSPMLRLFTALASAESDFGRSTGPPKLVVALDSLTSFTQEVPKGFNDFQLVNEDLNENEIHLMGSLPVFVTKQKLQFVNPSLALQWHGQQEEPVVVTIPAGASGRIVKETAPYVLKLDHPHSGVQYLGLLLSTFLPNNELVPFSSRAILDHATAAEIVTLVTAMLSAALKQEDGKSEARTILERLRHGLQEEQDIVLIITDIFESELLAHLDQVAGEGSLELVTACVEFLVLMVQLSPERVWSVLARSSLLGLSDGATSLASVVSGVEAQAGQYRFLKAVVRLHMLLLDDAIAGSVKRKGMTPRTTNRFQSPVDSADSTPERTMSAVLKAYQTILLDIFQTLPDWKFHIPQERCRITTDILDAFTTLLSATYGVDVSTSPSQGLNNVLTPAADILLITCAPMSGVSAVVKTCTAVFSESLSVAEDGLLVQLRGLLIQQTKSALHFLELLVRATAASVGHTTTSRNERTSNKDSLKNGVAEKTSGKQSQSQKRAVPLATYLLGNMPIFASLLACDHAFKGGVYDLLSEVIQTVDCGDEDPPSMLAQLNTDAQRSLLVVVTQLDRPLCEIDVERKVWDFLSIVLSSRQQWFAVYLLTGELPRKRAHRRNSNPIKGRPILGHALDELAHIAEMAPDQAIGMLKFVANAQQAWTWATTMLRSHASFLKNTLSWIDALSPVSRDITPAASVLSCKEYVMASLLCDIYAVNLHASMETGDKTLLKSLTQKLSFLRDHGVKSEAYNKSLHDHLASNLKRTFPQSDLSDFKRTAINPGVHGFEFYYDREIAGSVLGHHQAWDGANGSRSQGLADEFARANANLSLLDGQVRLLASWKTLATTLCESAEHDASLQVELAKVAERCLLENARPQMDEPGTAEVLQLRAELAFVLASKLVSLRFQDDAMKSLLPAAWGLVRSSPVDYDVATVTEDVQYYRQLLQVLYLTVQPHIYAARPPNAELEYLAPVVASMLVDIVGKVIAPGFRALCGNLHSDIELALPADFALITALLQAILAVPGISSVYTLLSDIIAGSSVVRGALSLYSWSDRLSEATGQDPLYGEVAIMFLLALSSVRPIAEQMSLEGALANIVAANLSNYLRKAGGKGPWDEPQRMFVIWTDGLLPLCLNLLDSVGPPMAAEVAAFLNSFPEQLRRAEKSLSNEAPSVRNPRAGALTLGLVSEAHSLTMIAMILTSDTARGAAEGINAADIAGLAYDHELVQSAVGSITRNKRGLTDRITPNSALEEKWLQTQGSASGDSVLRQKIARELDSMTRYLGSSEV